ncbi:MAG: hypothetical protein ACKVZ0_21730 [Gemmatimonadales bacterium]
MSDRGPSHPPRAVDTAGGLAQAYSELTRALGGIQRSRQTLARYHVDRLAKGQARLTEVSSATESATTALLNGLDRSLGLIDQIAKTPGHGTAAVEALREETNALYSLLQFQDITTQQLAGVATLLDDIADRVTHALELLGPGHHAAGGADSATDPVAGSAAAFNEDASFHNLEARQADIDQTFTGGRPVAKAPA